MPVSKRHPPYMTKVETTKRGKSRPSANLLEDVFHCKKVQGLEFIRRKFNIAVVV